MIGEVLNMATSDPQGAVRAVRQQVSSAGQIGAHALGMTGDEVRQLMTRGVPMPVVALLFFSVGAAVALRYAPDSWTKKVRQFGR